MPKVSICIPAYEQIEYLKISLDSVLEQSFSDYEIILTDDSKSDIVEDLVKEYNFNGRLIYIRNKSRLGSPGNWNEAIKRATGEYIKIMHHDEWFNYDFSLEKFVEALEKNPGLDFVFCAVQGYNVKQNFKWLHKPSPLQLKNLKNDPLLLFFGNFIGSPSNIIFRRNSDCLFDTNLIWCVDFEFYIRILLRREVFYYIDYDLVTSVTNADHNITNNCINNREIEIFEYTYLYHKYSQAIKVLQYQKFIGFFMKLFKKYNIVSVKQILQCGYINEVPSLIKASLFFNRIMNDSL